jgi:predicted transporter
MELILGLAVSVITQFVKKFIEPKFGKNGVLIFVIILAFLVSTGLFFLKRLPEEYLKNLTTIALSAVGFYEFLYKGIYGTLKGKSETPENTDSK